MKYRWSELARFMSAADLMINQLNSFFFAHFPFCLRSVNGLQILRIFRAQ